MDFTLHLTQFSYHYVDPRRDGVVFSSGEQDLSALPAAIGDFLLGMIAEIWTAPDAGSTRSARFSSDAERLSVSAARPLIATVIQDPSTFFTASKQLAELLYEQSPANASPGILGVFRLERPEDGAVFAALVKIRHRDEEFVRLSSGDLPLLHVETVRDILLKEIQKAALIPHPEKPEYDLKVIDAQARDDPAAYFTEKFLGCLAKRSDDLQIKKLIPTLEQFAFEKQIPVAVEKVARVIQELQQQSEDISGPVLAQVVEEQGLFGEEFEEAEFKAFLQETSLGELDIPKEQFQRGRRTGRKVVYRFLDPEYEGLEISGPPETFQKVLSSQGSKIIFTIQTSNEGIKFGYQ